MALARAHPLFRGVLRIGELTGGRAQRDRIAKSYTARGDSGARAQQGAPRVRCERNNWCGRSGRDALRPRSVLCTFRAFRLSHRFATWRRDNSTNVYFLESSSSAARDAAAARSIADIILFSSSEYSPDSVCDLASAAASAAQTAALSCSSLFSIFAFFFRLVLIQGHHHIRGVDPFLLQDLCEQVGGVGCHSDAD